MDPVATQTLLFRHLKNQLPPHKAFVDEVADVLGISNDSAYRRIRGEKPIDLNELQKLATHFRVSVDHLLDLQSDTLLFSGRPPMALGSTLENWLANLLAQLQLVTSFERRHGYYLLKDIPPFYYFQVPELAEFKFFFWMKSILHYEHLKTARFQLGDARYQELHATCQQIVALYNQLPTTEIWNVESLNSTLRQIEFYHQTGVFTQPDDARLLYSKVEELLDSIEQQAEAGLKSSLNHSTVRNPASYRLFVNELILGDNTFLVELDNTRITFLNHSVLHFVATRDEAFNSFMFANLDNLMKKSTLISGVGEKERRQFFNALRQHVQQRLRLLY